ncbi:hypothetical protein ACSSS7_006607 [Eimeria intestinalis]
MAFFARVSDPRIGGSYMTFLNTVANVGSQWPRALSLWLMDSFAIRDCTGVDMSAPGAKCSMVVDGYFVQVAACVLLASPVLQQKLAAAAAGPRCCCRCSGGEIAAAVGDSCCSRRHLQQQKTCATAGDSCCSKRQQLQQETAAAAGRGSEGVCWSAICWPRLQRLQQLPLRSWRVFIPSGHTDIQLDDLKGDSSSSCSSSNTSSSSSNCSRSEVAAAAAAAASIKKGE